LCARHQLRALILGGLCAGAISSIRARTLVGDQVAGLLLLEPNFRSSADVRAQPAEAGVSSEATPPRRHSRWRRTLGRLLDVNEVLCILTGESRLARPFAPLRPMLERMLQRRVGKSLPRDVLVSEVLAWSRMLEHEVPSLAVAAKGMGTDRFLDRIIGVFPACNSEQLRRVLIPDTNHILTAGEARHLTIHAVERWLIDRFPDAVWSDSAPAALAEPRSRISAGA
jgi:hypothetical protein